MPGVTAGGGFVGTTGPDKVVGGNGLDLSLLGV